MNEIDLRILQISMGMLAFCCSAMAIYVHLVVKSMLADFMKDLDEKLVRKDLFAQYEKRLTFIEEGSRASSGGR